MNAPAFTETQRFDQWWIRLLFLGLNGLFAVALWRQLVQGIPFGDHALPDGLLVVMALLMAAGTYLFTRMRLETRVDDSGIALRFAPWHSSHKRYGWDAVKACRVRRYQALWEHGGWGLRGSFNGRVQAYTTAGDQGLELELTTGRTVLIGTRRPRELEAVLRAMGKL